MISVIIPVYNEGSNILSLHRRLCKASESFGQPCEFIFINDGSTDDTGDRLDEVAAMDRRAKVIRLRRNFGQTAALLAGIDAASGDYLVPMDGDLQNDPADIQALLEKLEEGFDVVSGWRKNRQDDYWKRSFPSRIANWLISKVSGVRLHDYGCSLKVYRAEVLKGIRLYGEMHRFLPIYAHWRGAKITELPVHHHPRVSGQSKYGLERIIKVLLDLMVVRFMQGYQTKPIYVFGGFGLACIAVSGLTALYMLYLKLYQGVSFILTPLPLLVALSFLAGMLSLFMGLLAEIGIRTYFESQNQKIYMIDRMVNFDSPLARDRKVA
jgi:glycosyltransferase involved in cell wall biosynthesis